MKKLFKYFICTVLVIISIVAVKTQGFCASHPIKTIAVMTDTNHRNGTSYLICGAAADIFATDIINRINMSGRMKAPVLGETMSKITQQNIPLFYVTFLNEYKYNYNIDFVNLKRVTKNIQADYILMITSGMDVQSQFLKDTWWNKLNIPGMDPVKPTYKLSTLITLIDKKTYNIVWQDLYLRDIEAHNYDLGIVQFSPSYAQLTKIKKYSQNMSEYVTNIIDQKVNPWIIPPQEPKSVEMKYKFLNEGTKVYYPKVNGEVVKENFNEFKTEKQKQWNEYQQKRQQQLIQKEQQKQQRNIQNVNYYVSSETKGEIPAVQMNTYQQPVQNYSNMTPSQIRARAKEDAKIQKAMKQQILEQQKEEQKYIQKHKKDKQLFDSIRNNIQDITNTLPDKEDGEKFILTNPEIETGGVYYDSNGFKLKPKVLDPSLYQKQPVSEQESIQK